jgi:hypothetical protein
MQKTMFGSRHLIALCTILWFVAIGYGLHAIMVYKGRPGPVGQTPKSWPQNTAIALPAGKPQLVMFAHPQCPCTKASLGELELLAADGKGKFEATVCFYVPGSKTELWDNTPNVHSARSIPGTRVIFDKDGKLANQFGAETSGQTVLYSPEGRLLFSGGLTGSRGHLGDNAGFASVLKLINEPNASPTRTKVFGCELFDRCTNSQTIQTK